jgi:hypothetical protein
MVWWDGQVMFKLSHNLFYYVNAHAPSVMSIALITRGGKGQMNCEHLSGSHDEKKAIAVDQKKAKADMSQGAVEAPSSRIGTALSRSPQRDDLTTNRQGPKESVNAWNTLTAAARWTLHSTWTRRASFRRSSFHHHHRRRRRVRRRARPQRSYASLTRPVTVRSTLSPFFCPHRHANALYRRTLHLPPLTKTRDHLAPPPLFHLCPATRTIICVFPSWLKTCKPLLPRPPRESRPSRAARLG